MIRYIHVRGSIYQVWRGPAFQGVIHGRRFKPCKFAPALTEDETAQVLAWAGGLR